MRFGESETVQRLKGIYVVLRCNSWRQAQICIALARASDDPALKQHYEELALEFVRSAGKQRSLDPTAAPLAAINPKPDRGNTNPHR